LQRAYRGHANEKDAIHSLVGPWSKIWAMGDAAYFHDAPDDEFRPCQWARLISVWLKAPCPRAPSIEVKGTWVSNSKRMFVLDPSKADRDRQLHEKGGA
jgi:hypothetical protein